MFKRVKKIAFSLAEVMVVLAIVTAVVAVSVKITKARYEAANKYLYYTAYSTLKSLVAEVHLEVNSEKDDRDAEEAEAAGVTPSELPSYYNEAEFIPDGSDEDTLCSRISSIANLHSTASACSGAVKEDVEAVASSDEKYFGNLTPDLTLRNGMKLYSVMKTENPSKLTDLKIYNEDGTENERLTSGAQTAYRIYVDVDGDRGDSVLWVDVYPFFVTLNGYVIPDYKDGGFGGANNIADMATSVEYDDVDPTTGKASSKWLVRNDTFIQTACNAGFVNGNSYCGDTSTHEKCVKSESNFANCRVRVIAPVKVF